MTKELYFKTISVTLILALAAYTQDLFSVLGSDS